MSESEDVPLAERGESEVGCHWTARLMFQVCQGGECHDAEILAFDFQKRAWDYYQSNRSRGGITRAPPIEEAFWIAMTPRDELHASFELCPGLVAVALLLAAELHFAAMGPGASAAAEEQLRLAKAYMVFLRDSRPTEFAALLDMWPVEAARDRADEARRLAAAPPPTQPPSVDVVVARCRTSLRWLWSLPLPPQARLIVYEKCPQPPGELEKQVEGLLDKVSLVLRVSAHDEGPWMTGECGAYLRQVLAGLDGTGPVGSLADFTVFIHDDAPRHLKPAFLSLVFQALARGSYDVHFLNLAHERYLQMATPCLRDLYRKVFGHELPGRLSTYCCGHFVVSAERARAVPRERFGRLWDAVTTGSYAAKVGGPCEVAHMPCYVVEHIWHVLFGEELELPWRSEDARLPLAFRYEGGRETRLPSPLKMTPYMDRAAREP